MPIPRGLPGEWDTPDENEYLKAVFLPELGGRLISLFHKPSHRERLFNNPVFQPANLALRDAWFAGGIEWNIGQFGHTYQTCSPVFATSIDGPGSGEDRNQLPQPPYRIDFRVHS